MLRRMDFPRERPLAPPIWRGTVFEFDSARELSDTIVGARKGYAYGRYDNPTVVELERAVAALEGAERGLAFASGMAAIATALLALVPPGGRVVRQRELYGGTSALFREVVEDWAGEVATADAREPDRIEEEIRRGADVVYLETPVNPTLDIVDLPRLAAAARDAGALVVVDNTFATPLGQRPLALGAHVAVHSATKLLAGHHDVVAGVLATSDASADRIESRRRLLGGVLSPADAWLVLRGVKTLRVRVRDAEASATELARRLLADPRVRGVRYPGLPDDPGHELAARQMDGFGTLLAFEAGADLADAERLLDALRTIRRAGTLGGVDSTVLLPATTSHASISAEERRRMGVPDTLVRLSVGNEPVEELWTDLDRALASLVA
jgi:cystathionine gamma-synthase